jgi:hypothetical protein
MSLGAGFGSLRQREAAGPTIPGKRRPCQDSRLHVLKKRFLAKLPSTQVFVKLQSCRLTLRMRSPQVGQPRCLLAKATNTPLLQPFRTQSQAIPTLNLRASTVLPAVACGRKFQEPKGATQLRTSWPGLAERLPESSFQIPQRAASSSGPNMRYFSWTQQVRHRSLYRISRKCPDWRANRLRNFGL